MIKSGKLSIKDKWGSFTALDLASKKKDLEKIEIIVYK